MTGPFLSRATQTMCPHRHRLSPPNCDLYNGLLVRKLAGWTSFLPRAGLDYQWTSELMTYVSGAEGSKSGGVHTPPGPPPKNKTHRPGKGGGGGARGGARPPA